MSIRVAVAGAAGRMGREVVRAVMQADDVALVGAADPQGAGADAAELAGLPSGGVAISSDLARVLDETRPDVLVDFTVAASAMPNIRLALGRSVSPIVGTTGLTADNIEETRGLAQSAAVGALIAPNFAIGAVLMMRFAAEAARYLPDVEIIELHHDKKLDSPSGTAMMTAQRIAAARQAASAPPPVPPPGAPVEKAPGARGACVGDVHVHSVRLPGHVAHQQVVFGGTGETLTIRHDSLDRTSFMPGVLLAVRRVRDLPGLVVGLEPLLFPS